MQTKTNFHLYAFRYRVRIFTDIGCLKIITIGEISILPAVNSEFSYCNRRRLLQKLGKEYRASKRRARQKSRTIDIKFENAIGKSCVFIIEKSYMKKINLSLLRNIFTKITHCD